ncbi:MAG: tetratricopeptide repeat protein, partial [Bacteroidales bacterium]|nr:tetratricopeptide repeat protein [Bacteroidales bacterium]
QVFKNNKFYKPTNTLFAIVKKIEKNYHLITAFPGEFAPALPNEETQNPLDFTNSFEFWNKHEIAYFSMDMTIAEKIRHIQISLQKIWKERYIKTKEALEEISLLENDSESIDYKYGFFFAKLYRLWIELLQSQDDENSLEKLSEIYRFFLGFDDKKGIIATLYVKACHFDLYGLYEEGISAILQCLKLLSEDKDYNKEMLSDCYSQAGFLFLRIEDFFEAEKYFANCLKIREELSDKYGIAASLNQLARISVLKKNYVEAENLYFQSIKIREELGQTGAIIWSFIGLANLYEESNNYKKADEYYEKALIQSEKSVDERALMMSLEGKAKVCIYNREYEDSISLLEKALKLAKSNNQKAVEYKIHYLLSEALDSLGKRDAAFFHFKEFHNLKESIMNNEQINKMKKQQLSYAVESAEKEAEIERLKNVELKKANDLISLQKTNLEEAFTDIKQSINYASLIQTAVLPDETNLKKHLDDAFILFLPKDVVSGDFYWFEKTEKGIVITAADCTGHGVPGAFMSMLGISFLNEIVNNRKNTAPDLILNQLREKIIQALKQEIQNHSETAQTRMKDGMDMAIVYYDFDSGFLFFSGANNPLYLISNNQRSDLQGCKTIENDNNAVYEIKADKMPVAIHLKMNPFTLHKIEIQKGDSVYLFSDGYADQFGGEFNKKFKYKPFKELLLDNYNLPMANQKLILDETFKNWKKGYEQMDDVIVLGIKF